MALPGSVSISQGKLTPMKTQRWRITFAKTEAMRFTGHLDLILTWERTFRRSGLPLSYSEGFNPRPVINLAAPLPLGFTSKGEIGDFWLSESISKDSFFSSLDPALPPGIVVQEINDITHLQGSKLPSLVQAAIYRMTLTQTYPKLESHINELISTKTFIRTRKGKEYDLRPLIQELCLIQQDLPGTTVLEAKLSMLPGATGRPDEILDALGIPPLEAMINREKILLRPDTQKI
jgi:radical SAM-linked protein